MDDEIEQPTNDEIILYARGSRREIIERLREVALSEPATHVTIGAAKTLLEIADQQTSDERDPMGLDRFIR
jgi:hypothetical protein